MAATAGPAERRLSPPLSPVTPTTAAAADEPTLTPSTPPGAASAALAAPSPLPTISSDEDRSSEDDSFRGSSPVKGRSNSSSISGAVPDVDAVDSAVEMDDENQPPPSLLPSSKGLHGAGNRSRTGSGTSGRGSGNDNIPRLTAAEIQQLASSPLSLPIAPAPPQRSFFDQERVSRFSEQREASCRLMRGQPDPRWPESTQTNGGHRSSPAPRTVSTPPTSRTQTADAQSTSTSPRRYSMNPGARPPSLHIALDGTMGVAPGPRTGPAALPPQHIDSSVPRPPSPIPQIMPLPPMSLPTHLQLEMAAQRPSPLYIHQSHANDLPYESNAIKLERLMNVLLLPAYLERTLNFGAFACLDAWLYNFTILPVRFLLALTILVKWWGYVVGKEVRWLVAFVWDGLGRLWQRGRSGRPARAPADRPAGEQPRSRSVASETSTDGAPTTFDLRTGRRRNVRLNSNGQARGTAQNQNSAPETGSFRHRRTKSVPSTLSAFHKADLLQGAVIICSSVALMRLDASRMYHFIRGQSAIKLYVIYNILEVGDRLLSALGQDILECLFSAETLSRNGYGRSRVLMPLGMFCLALIYSCLHSIALYYQVITLNVAVNSYSNALLTLLLSNQFVEIKSTVFKRCEKDSLFQLTCADIVERFQLWIMLLIIGMRNVVEVGGLSVPGAGLDASSEDPSSPPPLHSNNNLPNSFTVLPSWIMSGEVLSPFLIVIASEMLVDTIKHAYVTKFNNIKPTFYSRILDILCKDYYTNAFVSPSLTRRLGLAVIPLSCLFIRASVQTYHMFLSTHLPMPMPPSTQTSLAEESAVPTSPAVMAALNRLDSLIRDSLGRATYGYPFGSPLNSRPWYAWTSDDFVATITMVVVFFIVFLVLLILKLLLGMLLLSYSRNRYAEMKKKEHSVAMGKSEYDSHDTQGRRTGGRSEVEVGDDRQRWIHADKTEGLKGGKGIGGKRPAEEKKQQKSEVDYSSIFRYEMVSKRIW